MATDHELEEKIPDPELLEFARGDSAERRTAILELDVPEPEVAVPPSREGEGDRLRRARIRPESPAVTERIENAMAEAEEDLRAILDRPPTPLRLARAFVVSVTPAQLRELAGKEFTKVVRESRRIS